MTEKEFKARYQNIRRTETLSLPTYKSITDDLKNSLKGAYVVEETDDFSLCFQTQKNKILLFSEIKDYVWDITKENYLEACELCRKLFLGENV